jgi:hypothetical protein
MALWVASARKFGLPADAFIMLAIQNLGHAERPLLAMEANLAMPPTGSVGAKLEHSARLTECFALSSYWVFGLYEMMRTAKQTMPAAFEPLKLLFHKVEVARMPLAKHEVKSAPGYREVSHFPTSVWCPETGSVGWHAFDPVAKNMLVVTRTALADEFLAITALDSPAGEQPPINAAA